MIRYVGAGVFAPFPDHERPHGWYVTSEGGDRFGPLPERARKPQPKRQARSDRSDAERAAQALLAQTERAERARKINPWGRG